MTRYLVIVVINLTQEQHKLSIIHSGAAGNRRLYETGIESNFELSIMNYTSALG